jgi:hypothetical protein
LLNGFSFFSFLLYLHFLFLLFSDSVDGTVHHIDEGLQGEFVELVDFTEIGHQEVN